METIGSVQDPGFETGIWDICQARTKSSGAGDQSA